MGCKPIYNLQFIIYNLIPRPFLLLCLGLLFFVPFLGSVHLFDWDEINFAESAREMLLSNNFTRVQIGFQAFWEKPPLFFWLQSAAMKVVGINEWGARLPTLCLVLLPY